MTTSEREVLAHLKGEANSPKSDLMRLATRVAAVSPAQARKLERIIGTLEAWQNAH